jgi:hypothetical protein
MVSLMMSHRGVEFVMTMPRSGCGGLVFAAVRRDRTEVRVGLYLRVEFG